MLTEKYRTAKKKLEIRLDWMQGNLDYLEHILDDLREYAKGRISEDDIPNIKGLLEKIEGDIFDFNSSYEEAVSIVANENIVDSYNKLPNPGVGYSEQYAK